MSQAHFSKKTKDWFSDTYVFFSWKRHALCYAVFGFAKNRWLNTLYGIVWETKYVRFKMLNIPKCEHFTLLVCPLRFLVISAMRRLGNVQSFKTYMFRFWAFCHERDPGYAGYPTLTRLHGKLSPRLTGLPYLADRATCLGRSKFEYSEGFAVSI